MRGPRRRPERETMYVEENTAEMINSMWCLTQGTYQGQAWDSVFSHTSEGITQHVSLNLADKTCTGTRFRLGLPGKNKKTTTNERTSMCSKPCKLCVEMRTVIQSHLVQHIWFRMEIPRFRDKQGFNPVPVYPSQAKSIFWSL